MQGFGIKNFRSFDSEGIFLDNIKKINIIIGKNNCGKSNVLRFLQILHSNLKNLNEFPNDITNQHRRNGKSTVLSINIKGENFHQLQNTHNQTGKFNYKEFSENYHSFDFDLNFQNFELPSTINDLDWKDLVPFQKQYTRNDKSVLIELIKKIWKPIIEENIKHLFKDLIYIPHLRVIKEGHLFGDSNSSINGSNIISKMFEMQNPQIGEEKSRDKFNLIQTFVSDLINKPELTIEIPHNKKEIVLTIDNNRLPLDSFGTGIHQLVMLCSTLVIHEDAIVCIEEPEIHLHPELQRKFINFLGKTKNTYFITTHSNVFLDSRHSTSIYHVQNDGIKSTISHANQTTKTFTILNDLGYQSSDILQSNGIIWVEGPSDRIYLLKWISLIDKTLIEGLHFSIMFYGGRLLSNLSFDNERAISELIPLLKLNRNAFVIMDRDGFTTETKINETKARIKKELGDRNSWITKGREIENYLTEQTLKKWLQTEKLETDANKKIGETIAKVSEKKYDLAKNKFATEIIKHIEVKDLEMLDLKLKLNQIIKNIKTWNN